MALRIGQILQGSKCNYRRMKQLGVGDKTVKSNVFKAEVLPGAESIVEPRRRWAAIKTTDPIHRDSLKREYDQHVNSYIRSSIYFRQMYDTINFENATTWSSENPFCLVLEWMDTTLAQLPPESYYQTPLIVCKIFEALLEGPTQLAKHGQVHSDFKPANVLISAMGSSNLPCVKIGDLGLSECNSSEAVADGAVLIFFDPFEVGPEGRNEGWLQPTAFRAPEFWTGIRCYHDKADILQWIDADILGVNDIEAPFPPMTWCLAKIMRPFGSDAAIAPPPPHAPDDAHSLRCFGWAKQLISAPRKDNPEQLILQTPPFELWAELALEQGVPKEVPDMIRFLAVPDPEKRPSALQALASREFEALKSAADSWMLDINDK